jgi:hypothetical protein
VSGPEILIPISFFFSVAAVLVLRGPLGKAIADAIAHRAGVRPEGARAGSERLEQLEAELAELKQRLVELEERQDFAERLLVQQRERGRLPAES